MKRLVLAVLAVSACLHHAHEDQRDTYRISLLIDNQSAYLISVGGAGRVYGNVLPGEQKCVALPNNDSQQQLWFQMQATRTKYFTVPFYPREQSGWKWTITGLGPPDHAVGRADAANIVHWDQCW